MKGQGVIHGNVVILDEDVHFPEGVRVTVTVEPETLSGGRPHSGRPRAAADAGRPDAGLWPTARWTQRVSGRSRPGGP